MNSSLQFDNFKVLEMSYRRNIDVNKMDSDDELEPEFSVNIGMSKENVNKGIVKLGVKIGEKETSYEHVFVEVLGFFTFNNEDGFEKDEIHNYYKVNGTAILFPYLRTLVSDLTSKGDESPIILPTINVNAFFD